MLYSHLYINTSDYTSQLSCHFLFYLCTNKFALLLKMYLLAISKIPCDHCTTCRATHSARLRSLIMSVESSSPTLILSRPGGLVLLSGGSMLARCSIRVSVPPKLVPRSMTRTAAAIAVACRASVSSKLRVPPKSPSGMDLDASLWSGWVEMPG